MPAIITDTFKKQLTQTIFDESRLDSARYYIGIGKSEPYDSSETVPTPTDTPRTIRNIRAGMQSIKSASDLSYVIPRYNWTSGAFYNGYDDDFASITATNSYYVLKEDKQRQTKVKGLLREFFTKGKVLAKELDLYKSLLESKELNQDFSRRVHVAELE